MRDKGQQFVLCKDLFLRQPTASDQVWNALYQGIIRVLILPDECNVGKDAERLQESLLQTVGHVHTRSNRTETNKNNAFFRFVKDILVLLKKAELVDR